MLNTRLLSKGKLTRREKSIDQPRLEMEGEDGRRGA
jgi:hypothetical protein